MWSRKINKCQFKDGCPLGSESCRFSFDNNYSDCDLYHSFTGEDNNCPYKNKCGNFPYSCLFSDNFDSCFEYGVFSVEEKYDEEGKYDEDENMEDYEDSDLSMDDDINNLDEEDDLDVDEEIEDKDEILNEKSDTTMSVMEQIEQMSDFTVFNSKQAFSFTEHDVVLYIKDDEGKWNLVDKVKHNLDHHSGFLIPMHWRLYLWDGQKSYVLGRSNFLPFDFSFLNTRKHFFEEDSSDISQWQWHEIDREDFVHIYLCLTNRDPLNTKVTDRESRIANKEAAIDELTNGSWRYALPMDEMWTIDKERENVRRQLQRDERQKDNGSSHRRNEEVVDEEVTKSHIVAGILAIFLGSFGAHKFYMGKYLMGFVYFIFCWTYIPFVIGIIEGAIYLLEGQEKFNDRI